MSSTTGLEPRRRKARSPRSLAGRLAIWNAASSMALVLLATGFLYGALVWALDREDDRLLADRAALFQTLLGKGPGEAGEVREEAEREADPQRYERIFVRVVGPGGEPVAETAGMAAVLPRSSFPAPGAPGGALRGKSVGVFRMAAVRTAGSAEGDGAIQIAIDRMHEQAFLARLRATLWVVLGLSVLAAAAAGLRVAQSGVRPIQEIAAAAGRIGPATLRERLDPGRYPAELASLAGTFNEMLDRLEGSFARLSQFSANIAHELRTPVHALRLQAEVALGKERSAAEYREVLQTSLEECERLSGLIQSLLFLARAEDPATRIAREDLDVAEELRSLAELYGPVAGEAGLDLQTAAPAGLRIAADRTLLRQAIGNLVENALAATPQGGRVRIEAEDGGEALRLRVTDTGRGIAPEHLPRVFDRFYRADPSRSGATGGSGLGLAIVRSIAILHGGNVEIRSEPGKGTEVSIALPMKES